MSREERKKEVGDHNSKTDPHEEAVEQHQREQNQQMQQPQSAPSTTSMKTTQFVGGMPKIRIPLAPALIGCPSSSSRERGDAHRRKQYHQQQQQRRREHISSSMTPPRGEGDNEKKKRTKRDKKEETDKNNQHHHLGVFPSASSPASFNFRTESTQTSSLRNPHQVVLPSSNHSHVTSSSGSTIGERGGGGGGGLRPQTTGSSNNRHRQQLATGRLAREKRKKMTYITEAEDDDDSMMEGDEGEEEEEQQQRQGEEVTATTSTQNIATASSSSKLNKSPRTATTTQRAASSSVKKHGASGSQNPAFDWLDQPEVLWPTIPIKQQVRSLEDLAKQIASNENFVMRSDESCSLLAKLGLLLPNFSNVFECLKEIIMSSSIEYQAIIETYEGDIRLSQQSFCTAKREWAKEVAELKSRADQAAVYVASREDDYTKLENERYRVKRERDEVSALRVDLERRIEEMVAARKEHEYMASHFAERNKELSDRIPQLEQDATNQKTRGDTLQAAGHKLSQRVIELENEVQELMTSKVAALKRANDDHDELNGHLKRLQTTFHSVKQRKTELEQEVEGYIQEQQDREVEFKGKMEGLTPRPSFRPCDLVLFGTLQSTSNRVEVLSKQLETVESERDVLQAKYKKADAVNSLYQRVKPLLNPEPKRPMAEFFAVHWVGANTAAKTNKLFFGTGGSSEDDGISTPLGNIGGASGGGGQQQQQQILMALGTAFPPLFSSCEPKVRCRAMAFREIVLRARDLFDAYEKTNARSLRRVEMHTTVLSHFIDTYQISGGGGGGGLYVTVKDADGNEVKCHPQHVVEQCYSLLSGIAYWSAHPIIRAFGCVLREETGAWIWKEQNDFILSVMKALSSMGECPVADLTDTLCDTLSTEGFDEVFVSTVTQHFCTTYVTDALKANQQLFRNAPTVAEMVQSSMKRRQSRVFGAATPLSKADAPPGANSSMSIVTGSHIGDEARFNDTAEEEEDGPEYQISIRVEFDADRQNPSASSSVTEHSFVSVLRNVFLDRVILFNSAMDKFILTMVNKGSGGGGGGTLVASSSSSSSSSSYQRVSGPLAIAAVQSICPQTDLATAENFASEVFALCTQQQRLEAGYLKTIVQSSGVGAQQPQQQSLSSDVFASPATLGSGGNNTASASSGGGGVSMMSRGGGPASGGLASSTMFMAGFTAHYCGTARLYPVLINTKGGSQQTVDAAIRSSKEAEPSASSGAATVGASNNKTRGSSKSTTTGVGVSSRTGNKRRGSGSQQETSGSTSSNPSRSPTPPPLPAPIVTTSSSSQQQHHRVSRVGGTATTHHYIHSSAQQQQQHDPKLEYKLATVPIQLYLRMFRKVMFIPQGQIVVMK